MHANFEGHCAIARAIGECPTTTAQHPHQQIELRYSASGVQQFEPHPRQHVEDDADQENKMSLLRRIDLSIFQ